MRVRNMRLPLTFITIPTEETAESRWWEGATEWKTDDRRKLYRSPSILLLLGVCGRESGHAPFRRDDLSWKWAKVRERKTRSAPPLSTIRNLGSSSTILSKSKARMFKMWERSTCDCLVGITWTEPNRTRSPKVPRSFCWCSWLYSTLLLAPPHWLKWGQEGSERRWT